MTEIRFVAGKRLSENSTKRTIQRRKEILYLLFLFGVLVLSFEIVLRIVNTGRPVSYVLREARPWRDSRHSWDLYHPVLGWVNKPNYRGNRGYAVVTNTRGLRESREYAKERISGKARILALGDSFTFGVHVGTDEVYTEILERQMPGTEVINLGVRGYGTDQMLLMLKEEGVQYLPDLVLVGFFVGDMKRNLLTTMHHNKPRFHLEGEKLRLTNVPVPRSFPDERTDGEKDAPGTGIGLLGWGCRTCAWTSRRLLRLENALAFLGVGEGWRLTAATFREMDRVSAEVGAKLLIVVFPAKDWAKGTSNPLLGLNARLRQWSFRRVMERFSNKSGIPVLNLTEAFRNHYRNPKAHDIFPGHWNADGHRLVAKELRAYLFRHPEMLRARDPNPSRSSGNASSPN